MPPTKWQWKCIRLTVFPPKKNIPFRYRVGILPSKTNFVINFMHKCNNKGIKEKYNLLTSLWSLRSLLKARDCARMIEFMMKSDVEIKALSILEVFEWEKMMTYRWPWNKWSGCVPCCQRSQSTPSRVSTGVSRRSLLCGRRILWAVDQQKVLRDSSWCPVNWWWEQRRSFRHPSLSANHRREDRTMVQCFLLPTKEIVRVWTLVKK